MRVICPEGVYSGSPLRVNSPEGITIECQVPPGIGPGGVFEVQYMVEPPRANPPAGGLLPPLGNPGAKSSGDRPSSQTSSMHVICPHGMNPGQMIHVTSPEGELIQVHVPPGVEPGQVFEVQYQLPGGNSGMSGGKPMMSEGGNPRKCKGSNSTTGSTSSVKSAFGRIAGMLAPATQNISEKLGKQMESALAGTNNKHVNNLLDSALATRLFDQKVVPNAVRNAANEAASRQLQDAIDSNDPRRLKGALIAAGRLRATNLSAYEQAAHKYREVRRLPPGWDVAKMALQRKGSRMVDKPDIEDEQILEYFRSLVIMTHRKIRTRDRLGEALPDRLEILSVRAAANDEIWGDYMARREMIRLDIEENPSGFEIHPVQTTNSIPEFDSPSTGVSAEEIAEALSADWAPLAPEVNEVFLFHGTSGIAADSITTSDFKMNLSGSNAGTLYGRGIYFAENSSKSDEYTRDSGSGIRHLLLCRVTLGRVKYLDQKDVDPRECEDACLKGNAHSILGDRRKCRGTYREFAVFDSEQVYPNYIIAYRRRTNGTE